MDQSPSFQTTIASHVTPTNGKKKQSAEKNGESDNQDNPLGNILVRVVRLRVGSCIARIPSPHAPAVHIPSSHPCPRPNARVLLYRTTVTRTTMAESSQGGCGPKPLGFNHILHGPFQVYFARCILFSRDRLVFERTVLKMAGLLVVYSYCIVLSREKKKRPSRNSKHNIKQIPVLGEDTGQMNKQICGRGARAPGRTPEKPPHQEL